MTDSDIIGIESAASERKTSTLTDRETWVQLEALFPGLRDALLARRQPGRSIYITYELETPRGRARALDDGVMGIRELARLAGVAYETARKARRERAA